MILRPLCSSGRTSPEPQPAFEAFIASQKHVPSPFAIIFQAEHSRLAGDLIRGLLPDTFGDFPAEVTQATADHDLGWAASDQAQIRSLGQVCPRPFPDLSTEQALPAWRASTAHARTVSPLVDVLVSRHFSLLGASDPGRAEFVRSETERRRIIEPALPYSPADLERWTAALGFCDLLSLYLCCGRQQPVDFPLAHPAHPGAGQTSHVTLWVQGELIRFSSPVLKPGTGFSLTVRRYEGSGADLTPLLLEWQVARGNHSEAS